MLIPLRKKLMAITHGLLSKSNILRHVSDRMIPVLIKRFTSTIKPLLRFPNLASFLQQHFTSSHPLVQEDQQIKSIFHEDDGGASEIIEAHGNAFHALEIVCKIENEILEG